MLQAAPSRPSRELSPGSVEALAGLPRIHRAAELTDGLAEASGISSQSRGVTPAFEKRAGQAPGPVRGQALLQLVVSVARAAAQGSGPPSVLNWDINPATQIYYHGEDYRFTGDAPDEFAQESGLLPPIHLHLRRCFHFSNAHGMCFGPLLEAKIASGSEARGDSSPQGTRKKDRLYQQRVSRRRVANLVRVVGGHSGVHDLSVAQRTRACAPTNVICIGAVFATTWRIISVCWAAIESISMMRQPFMRCLSSIACVLISGGPTWQMPAHFRLPPLPPKGVRLYHGVGDRAARTDAEGVNIKCSHIYHPLIDKLRSDGYVIDLLEPTDVPNLDLRFLQVQSDIFLDMLTYGWFGATAREVMMLGKPVVGFIRPEWLDSVREELPDYAAELPIVNATPDTIEAVLRDLIDHPEKRQAIGQRSRAFALKWHSDDAGGRRFDEIYRRLLAGDAQLRQSPA